MRQTIYRSDIHDELARNVTMLGAKVDELSACLRISQRTLSNWLGRHPTFAAAVEAGRTVADGKVAHSLYTRANGYAYEAHKVLMGPRGPETVSWQEYVGPDTGACMAWLKNRRPDLWRERRDPPAPVDDPAAKVMAQDLRAAALKALAEAFEDGVKHGEIDGRVA